MARLTSLLLTLSLLVTGCGKSKEEPKAKETSKISQTEKNVDSVNGNWILRMPSQKGEKPLLMVNIAQATDGTHAVNFIGHHPDAPKGTFELASGKVTDGKQVELVISTPDGNVTFEGLLSKSAILGGLDLPGSFPPPPCRLVPTDDEAFTVENAQEVKLDAVNDLTKIDAAVDSLAALEEYKKSYPDIPHQLAAHQVALGTAKKQNRSEKEIKGIVESYLKAARKFGPLLAKAAPINAARGLIDERVALDTAEQTLNNLESSLTKTDARFLKAVESTRDDLKLARARVALNSGDKTEQTAAFEKLKDHLETSGFDPEVMYALANHAETQGKTEQALNLWGQLVALPQAEEIWAKQSGATSSKVVYPRKRLDNLWEKTHGEKKGLDEFLEKTYATAIYSFAEERQPARPQKAGKKTALLELFTSTNCPPCVGADVALGGIQTTYPQSDVIVLRYHSNAIGPDVMATNAGDTRLHFYQGRGTPHLTLNGSVVPGAGGYFIHSQQVYNSLRGHVESALAEPTATEIDLKSKLNGDKISVTINVTGAKDFTPADRLVLALVEESVPFTARNGVLHHEMLVRSMPLGTDGIAPESGKLSVEKTISLADVRKELLDGINAVERSGRKFESKPLDLKNLQLVAWVQNFDNHEIAQSTSVKVGENSSTSATPVKTPEPATKKEEPQPKTPEKSPEKEPAKAPKKTTDDNQKRQPVPAAKPSDSKDSASTNDSALLEDTASNQLYPVVFYQDDKANDDKPEEEGKPKKEKPAEPRKTTAGNWMMYLSRQNVAIPVCLVSVTEADGKYTAKLLTHAPKTVPPLKQNSATATDQSVGLKLSMARGTSLEFSGKLHQGNVLGSLVIGGQQTGPSFLVPTDAKKMNEDLAAVMPAPGAKEFEAAVEAEDPEALKKFAKAYPDSPLSLQVFGEILEQLEDEDLTKEMIVSLTDDAEATAKLWGEKMVRVIAPQVVQTLASRGLHPDYALEKLEAFEKSLSKEEAVGYSEAIEALRSAVQLSQAKVWINSDNEDDVKKGLALLEKLNDGMNGEVMYLLAEHHAKTGKVEEAIAELSRIVVLPGMQNSLVRAWRSQGTNNLVPQQMLEKLWEKKHGDTDDLDAYLTEQYRAALKPLIGEKAAPRGKDDGNQIALVELFTGAMCPPCVAADLATWAVEMAYPKDQVVVLRYHMHIPGPDPLVSPQNEDRFRYYNGRGTPTLTINGDVFPGAGGYLEHAQSNVEQLREGLVEELKKKTDIKLTLSAKGAGKKLKVSAEATGTDFEKNEDLRLKLCLVEEELEFAARNGIRMHEMVVRGMLGGAEGTAPEDGELSYSETINLPEFKQSLLDSLAEFEGKRRFVFEEKPLALKHLKLVGFVQNERTKEILQTAIIDVEGKLDFTAPPKKKAEKKVKPKKASEEKADDN